MIQKNKETIVFIFLLSIWALIKIFSAINLELIADEAYYALFAKHLDFGYFDHPPMVALFIAITSFIPSELGIRLMAILAQLLSLLILWQIASANKLKNDVLLFFSIASSILIFQVYGFIITPDSPLLLFCSLFLLLYLKFLDNNSYKYAILTGITMAAMLYSKYQGIILIIAVLLSNLNLIKNKKFLISLIVALLLFLPHIYWQYTNGFPSVKYHLFDRSQGFSSINLLNYITNQLLVLTPSALILTTIALFKFRPDNQFKKSLNFIFATFIIFFFIMSLKGHVEPQWTAVASLSSILILYNVGISNEKFKKIIFYSTIPFIIIVFLLNIEVIYNFTSLPKPEKYSDRVKKIAKFAENYPVIFLNQYQYPAEYIYYSGKDAATISDIYHRNTQFNIWNKDESYYNKTVLIQQRTDINKLSINEIEDKFIKISNYQPLNNIVIDYNLSELMRHDSLIEIPISISNPYPFEINVNHSEMPFKIFAVINNNNYCCSLFPVIEIIKPNSRVFSVAKFVLKDKIKGNAKIQISIFSPNLGLLKSSKNKNINL